MQEVKTSKKRQKEKDTDEDKAKDEKKPAKKAKTDDEETIWDLGNNRQVNVRNFRGKYYVDIREMYYDKDGDLKPGKKGNIIFAKTTNFIANNNFIMNQKINLRYFNIFMIFLGICLTMQQWRKFMNVVEEVDKVAKSKS